VKPSVGRIVHYVSHGTPRREDGTQAFTAECRAAIVTEVEPSGERVGLAVLNPTGIFLHSLAAGGCPYHDTTDSGGDPNCPQRDEHGSIFRYCGCGWMEASPAAGTWHWPERVE